MNYSLVQWVSLLLLKWLGNFHDENLMREAGKFWSAGSAENSFFAINSAVSCHPSLFFATETHLWVYTSQICGKLLIKFRENASEICELERKFEHSSPTRSFPWKARIQTELEGNVARKTFQENLRTPWSWSLLSVLTHRTPSHALRGKIRGKYFRCFYFYLSIG